MSDLLEDLLSGDATRVWSSSCAIIKLRDNRELDRLASHLGVIRRETENLSLGGAMFPNAEHLRFAVQKLGYHARSSGCLCRLYPQYLLYNPRLEAADGNVVIDSVSYVDGKWVDAYQCHCAVCGQVFRVEEREYHYTWWSWRAERPSAAPNGNA